MSTIWIPLPDTDFDVTEVAVPWRLFTDAGHVVVFTTESGDTAPACDPLLLTGVVFGQLGAEPEAKRFYEEMIASAEFQSPRAWADVGVSEFDGLILPGGHAQGMKQYLGSGALQEQVGRFWAQDRPVGAICHGVLVLARTPDPAAPSQSVLAGVNTTCLPAYMERLAYYLTAWKLGKYYRTYPAYVEAEVRESVGDGARFHRGPINLGNKATADDDRAAFVVEDGRYVSARWPGDAYLFARKFMERLQPTGDATGRSTPAPAPRRAP